MTTKTGAFILIGSITSATIALLPLSTAVAEDSLAVSAKVVATCNVVGGPASLEFGDYNPGTVTDHEVPTEFSVACTTPTTVLVGLGAGEHFSGGTRRMAGGPDFLNYELYHDDGESPFGDGSGLGTGKSVTITDPLLSESVPLIGIIPADQPVLTGIYTDTVQISFAF